MNHTCGGVYRFEGLAVNRFDELVVDEETGRLHVFARCGRLKLNSRHDYKGILWVSICVFELPSRKSSVQWEKGRQRGSEKKNK